MLQPLDGPSLQYKLAVTDSTVKKVEVSVGAGAFDGRKVITIQPIGGRIRVYFGDETTPSVSTVSDDGFLHFNRSRDSYEANASQDVFILAESGSVDVIIAERG